jgi:hypothetical protein
MRNEGEMNHSGGKCWGNAGAILFPFQITAPSTDPDLGEGRGGSFLGDLEGGDPFQSLWECIFFASFLGPPLLERGEEGEGIELEHIR